jgi:hypothetical protein
LITFLEAGLPMKEKEEDSEPDDSVTADHQSEERNGASREELFFWGWR